MEGTIGEIRIFAGNFAPRAWALCEGQLLAISSNTALFSILGTTFGGDGRTTFALPDYRGRFALSHGTGPGLTTRKIGERTGVETVTLTQNQMASHFHFGSISNGTASTTVNASTTNANNDATNNFWSGITAGPIAAGAFDSSSDTTMSPGAVSVSGLTATMSLGNTGGGGDHNNMMPYLSINFVICLQGTFPSRS